MTRFFWIPDYSVKNDYLDAQHQQIIDLINRAKVLDEKHKNGEEIDIMRLTEIIQELIHYTETHFTDEEKMLSDCNYPNLKRHKEIHQHLVNELLNLEKKMTEIGLAILPVLLEFLTLWLKRHILDVDHKYIPFMSQLAKP